MRIVGGEFRGRPLATPKSQDIRPTTDRTRESLFNILNHKYPEALDGGRVMDVFAGTGAVGLEALSRGCSQAMFVEMSVEGRGLIRSNIEALGLQGRTRILRRDATDLGSSGTIDPFDLLFADPPYEKGLGEKAMGSAAAGGWLKPGALAILEERSTVDPVAPKPFAFLETREFGDTRMHFYRYAPDR
ncbi:16S rRNA (guanine(966)-N(2))-methyltransferase RsmD [Rhizobium sp. G21]|uniref:16S rRNA (guanine(966)-N(2))-methyltransferase RsmD n=1 Tax=Rhizobium sp. G21 TaxID=2758439 RepID=UPI0016044D5E|nr:16S rRNA (guanine(966)-N(2))-methyltransferase RsmD [Rhizobium sp. G21]MBB1248880.1 16S rRNA (guanine(966)-N(2))-methyltransferase RsmD [Rhizobium sp. G21]